MLLRLVATTVLVNRRCLCPNPWKSRTIWTSMSLVRIRPSASFRWLFTITINVCSNPLTRTVWRLRRVISSWWALRVQERLCWHVLSPSCSMCLLPLSMPLYLLRLAMWARTWRVSSRVCCRWPTMMWLQPSVVSSL